MDGAAPYCTVDDVADGRRWSAESADLDVEDTTDGRDLARVQSAVAHPGCPHCFGSVRHAVRILLTHGVECRMALGAAGASAIGKQCVHVREPLGCEEIESVGEDDFRLLADDPITLLALLALLGKLPLLGEPPEFGHALAVTLSVVLVADVAEDPGEVAVTGFHLAAAGIAAQAPLGFLDVLESMSAMRPDEALQASGEIVCRVDLGEEKAPGAILRTSSLALLLGDDLELLLVASFQGMPALSRRRLVDSEEDSEENASDGPCELPLSQSGEAIGEGLRQLRERLQGILDGAGKIPWMVSMILWIR